MEEQKSIFRKESLDRISSPDKLDEYIHVTAVSVYILLAAIILIIAAFTVWMMNGTLKSTVVCKGIAEGGKIVCYVNGDYAQGIETGMSCTADGNEGNVISVSEHPLSFSEASEGYDDYSVYMLGLSDWNYELTIDAGGVPDGFTSVSITTGTISPIDFLVAK